MNSKSRKLWGVAKLLLGVSLVGYVIRSGMLDIPEVLNLLGRPQFMFVAFCFLGVSTLLCSLRWLLLLRAQKINLGFIRTLEFNLIGIFFNSFLPGAVGGDLVKTWYLAGETPDKKVAAISSILIDRAMGLGVFLIYASIALLLTSINAVQLTVLAFSVWGGTAAMFLGIVLYFSPVWPRNSAHKMLQIAALYRGKPSYLVAGVLLSLLSVLNLVIFWCFFGSVLNSDLNWLSYFFVVPVGQTVSTIPLLPGGIGVGQVAYYRLFEWAGESDLQLGPTLCSLIQGYTLLFSLIGAIVYVTRKSRVLGLNSKALSGPCES